MRTPRHFSATQKKRFLQLLRSTTQVEKVSGSDGDLKTKTRYEFRDSLTRSLPDVSTGIVDSDWITVVAIGNNKPVIEVHGGALETIKMGFTDPPLEDTELELDINLEVTLRWDLSDNSWRVQ